MANLRDGYSGFGFYTAIYPQDAVAGSPITGETIDRLGFDTVTFVILAGGPASTGAMPAASFWNLKLEHASVSALGIDAWSECYPSQMLHSVHGQGGAYSSLNSGIFQSINSYTDQSAIYKVGYIGNRRYARIVLSDVGAPSTFSIAATAILGKPSIWPVNEPTGI